MTTSDTHHDDTRRFITLLGGRYMTAIQAAGQGIDLANPGLIVLRTENIVPLFQFNKTRQLWPIVDQVNRLLGASHQPARVGCWWLEYNPQLDCAPAALIDTSEEPQLLELAQHVASQ